MSTLSIQNVTRLSVSFRSVISFSLFVFFAGWAVCAHGANRGVVLSWDPPPSDENISSYRIFYGTSSTVLTNVIIASASDAYDGTVINGLQYNTTYYFAVMSNDTDGNSSGLSDTVSITLLKPQPVQLSLQYYTDGFGNPYALAISGTNSTETDWELDYSTNMLKWTYLTGDHGINIYYVDYFDEGPKAFFRVVDN